MQPEFITGLDDPRLVEILARCCCGEHGSGEGSGDISGSGGVIRRFCCGCEDDPEALDWPATLTATLEVSYIGTQVVTLNKISDPENLTGICVPCIPGVWAGVYHEVVDELTSSGFRCDTGLGEIITAPGVRNVLIILFCLKCTGSSTHTWVCHAEWRDTLTTTIKDFNTGAHFWSIFNVGHSDYFPISHESCNPLLWHNEGNVICIEDFSSEGMGCGSGADIECYYDNQAFPPLLVDNPWTSYTNGVGGTFALTIAE